MLKERLYTWDLEVGGCTRFSIDTRERCDPLRTTKLTNILTHVYTHEPMLGDSTSDFIDVYICYDTPHMTLSP